MRTSMIFTKPTILMMLLITSISGCASMNSDQSVAIISALLGKHYQTSNPALASHYNEASRQYAARGAYANASSDSCLVRNTDYGLSLENKCGRTVYFTFISDSSGDYTSASIGAYRKTEFKEVIDTCYTPFEITQGTQYASNNGETSRIYDCK